MALIHFEFSQLSTAVEYAQQRLVCDGAIDYIDFQQRWAVLGQCQNRLVRQQLPVGEANLETTPNKYTHTHTLSLSLKQAPYSSQIAAILS